MNNPLYFSDVIDSDHDELVELVRDLTPIPDIAILMGYNERDLREAIDDENHIFHSAYYRTLAETKRKIRHNDIELAAANSPTAMEKVNEYLKKMEE